MESSNKPKLTLTLGYLIKDDQVLLTMKKRGFGEGKYNGFGGKVERSETIEQGLIREAKEEIDVEIIESSEVGVIFFQFAGDPYLREVHIFLIKKWTGEPTESEEVRPEWFDKDKVPYEKMWPIDKHMLPKIFEGKKVTGNVKFNKEIIKKDLSFE